MFGKIMLAAVGIQGVSAGFIFSSDASMASGDFSLVGGGQMNTVTGEHGVILGGTDNQVVKGIAGSISGGGSNIASGDYAQVGGGRKNRAYSKCVALGVHGV